MCKADERTVSCLNTATFVAEVVTSTEQASILFTLAISWFHNRCRYLVYYLELTTSRPLLSTVLKIVYHFRCLCQLWSSSILYYCGRASLTQVIKRMCALVYWLPITFHLLLEKQIKHGQQLQRINKSVHLNKKKTKCFSIPPCKQVLYEKSGKWLW